MKAIKMIMSIVKSIFDRRQTSYEVQAYMELEMRKISNVDEKNFNDRLLNRFNS